jgi:hypothetical protein
MVSHLYQNPIKKSRYETLIMKRVLILRVRHLALGQKGERKGVSKRKVFETPIYLPRHRQKPSR